MPSTPHPSAVSLPTDKDLVLKVIPMPADCNANGDIFGGWVMAQVDLAGAVVPARYIQGRFATVAVNEFVFKQPVRVGDILSFFSSVKRIGNSSITVQVEVFAERFNNQGNYLKVTEASLTYVAIDDLGKPRPIRLSGDDQRQLRLPLTPGRQSIDIAWRSEQGMNWRYGVPSAHLGQDSVNHALELKLPPDRWLLFAFGPGKVVYVSCNPATQIRDLAEFDKAGYSATAVQPFDLFPQTKHLECVVTLKKNT